MLITPASPPFLPVAVVPPLLPSDETSASIVTVLSLAVRVIAPPVLPTDSFEAAPPLANN